MTIENDNHPKQIEKPAPAITAKRARPKISKRVYKYRPTAIAAAGAVPL